MFDFPEPTATNARRNITNVPLQGLFFLNSELSQHQAEVLAKRLTADRASDADRLQRAYNILYGREATPVEQHVALEFLATVQKKSGNSSIAWRELAQALLSANEFINLD
jgi:hypothetical protein